MATIATKMAPYEFVAAAWSQATEKVSLTEWLEDEYILVLGNDEQSRTALDAINRVLFKRLTELILAQNESTTQRTWIFLDEVREAGNLDGLGRLLTKGRSKGACVVLGFQDIEGLRDAYGKEAANEIVGMCANKAFLGLSSFETADWASKLFGEYEATEVEITLSSGSSHATGKTVTTGDSFAESVTLTRGKTATHGDTRTNGGSRSHGGGSSRGGGRSDGTSTSEGGSSTDGGAVHSGLLGILPNYSTHDNWSDGTNRSEGRNTTFNTSWTDSNNWTDGWSWSVARSSSDADSKSTSKGTSTTHNKSVADSQTDTTNTGDSASYKKVKSEAVMASEFLSIPPPKRETGQGLMGYFLVPQIGAFCARIETETLASSLVPPDETAPNVVHRPVEHQYLNMWDEKDIARLNLQTNVGTEPPGGVVDKANLGPEVLLSPENVTQNGATSPRSDSPRSESHPSAQERPSPVNRQIRRLSDIGRFE